MFVPKYLNFRIEMEKESENQQTIKTCETIFTIHFLPLYTLFQIVNITF